MDRDVVSCLVLHGRSFGLYRTGNHPVIFYSPAGTTLATASYSSSVSLQSAHAAVLPSGLECNERLGRARIRDVC